MRSLRFFISARSGARIFFDIEVMDGVHLLSTSTISGTIPVAVMAVLLIQRLCFAKLELTIAIPVDAALVARLPHVVLVREYSKKRELPLAEQRIPATGWR
jgi:hypothetical protein